ncbi:MULTISPECIES: DMT family transporter [Dickeya]|uniref:Threonine/homoserine exporter RhtA n=1 Tax=Dickeya fangzhongdai TaxID=1778540 RepID=A0A2K8QSC5_9GAMM|nr:MULTISPECIES: DMT family transporter [Dickeya]ATZ96401.1 EamA family transporter [Dickeya fangzhongdai]AYH50052.1 EamA family transporter [Dickeya fangzhongdai]MBO8135050.1 EamA family transporter [Dickeya fangzhongdai]QOH49845.1 EamA family transporter [Dickeya fangzhongdai]QOH54149.1 EamA family transporter [Dickeya fangzhongdai]
MHTRHNHIWIMVIMAVFFWGSNFNAIAELDANLPPIISSIVRFVIASVIFSFTLFIFKGRDISLSIKDVLSLALLGFLGIFCFNYAIFAGMKSTSPINGALIMANMPLVSILFSRLLLKAKVTLAQYIGLILGVFGVFLVIAKGNFSSLRYNSGDLWIIVSCACGGLYAVLTKKLITHVPPVQATRWTILFGTAFMLVFAALTHDISYDYLSISQLSYTLLAYMAIAGTVLAYYFWVKGCQVLGPEKTSITTNLTPVFTLAISFIMGKTVEPIQIIGMAVIIIGVLLGTGYLRNIRFFPLGKKLARKEGA